MAFSASASMITGTKALVRIVSARYSTQGPAPSPGPRTTTSAQDVCSSINVRNPSLSRFIVSGS